VIALCAAIVLSSVVSTTAVATSSSERQLHAMVNQARSANGKGRLSLSASLSRRAHRHSERMADSGTLSHSCLDCGKGSSPSSMAENVGVGPSLGAVHDALMNSPGHRNNILGAFDRVGIGVVRRGDRVWVTELFAG
jgi:uncharacterized protein YkwD